MDYEYSIVRTACKNMSIHISNRNVIVVHCPYSVSRAQIVAFVDSKSAWIEKVVERNAIRLAINDDVIEYRKIYVNGKLLPIIMADTNNFAPDAVYLKSLSAIERLFKEQFTEGLKETVYSLAKETLLHPANVSVKNYVGRWACCDAKNNLIFNYKMFMLRPQLQHYIIIHELCHTLCHNHSQAFWKLVSDYEPDWKMLRTELKNYDFLTSLYQNL